MKVDKMVSASARGLRPTDRHQGTYFLLRGGEKEREEWIGNGREEKGDDGTEGATGKEVVEFPASLVLFSPLFNCCSNDDWERIRRCFLPDVLLLVVLLAQNFYSL